MIYRNWGLLYAKKGLFWEKANPIFFKLRKNSPKELNDFK